MPHINQDLRLYTWDRRNSGLEFRETNVRGINFGETVPFCSRLQIVQINGLENYTTLTVYTQIF